MNTYSIMGDIIALKEQHLIHLRLKPYSISTRLSNFLQKFKTPISIFSKIIIRNKYIHINKI